MPAVKRKIPLAWLPQGALVKRVVMHWTAGRRKASLLDRRHYHLVVNGDGTPLRGVPLNNTLWPSHCRNLNTGSFGVSMAGMLGAVQYSVTDPVRNHAGTEPITPAQLEVMCQCVAEVCVRYDLDVTESRVLGHREVQSVYNLPQDRWDVDWLCFKPEMTPEDVRSYIRRKVLWYKTQIQIYGFEE